MKEELVSIAVSSTMMKQLPMSSWATHAVGVSAGRAKIIAKDDTGVGLPEAVAKE